MRIHASADNFWDVFDYHERKRIQLVRWIDDQSQIYFRQWRGEVHAPYIHIYPENRAVLVSAPYIRPTTMQCFQVIRDITAFSP